MAASDQRRWYGTILVAAGVVLRLPVAEFLTWMGAPGRLQEMVLPWLPNLHFQAMTAARGMTSIVCS